MNALAPQEVASVTRTLPIRVGIVDDDVFLLRALHRLLRARGLVVVAFDSGEAFLQALPTPAVDCLVLDIRLGALTGFDVHEALAWRGEAVPTIFITAHDDAATQARARDAGAVAYLRKPCDEDALFSAIQSAVAPDRDPA